MHVFVNLFQFCDLHLRYSNIITLHFIFIFSLFYYMMSHISLINFDVWCVIILANTLCAEVWSSLERDSYLILDPCFDFLCEFQSNPWVSKIIVVICLINGLLQSGPVFFFILWWHCTANHLQRYLACLPIDQLWTCRNLLKSLYIPVTCLNNV